MPARVRRFWVVTSTSLYEVCVDESGGYPTVQAKKIAVRGNSKIGVGDVLGGLMVGVMDDCMVGYMYGKRLPPEKVNTRYWCGRTSPITALFVDEQTARQCLDTENRQTWDDRWREQTVATMKAIGRDHSEFVISFWTPGGEDEVVARYVKILKQAFPQEAGL